jgi:hypothetical protein
MRVRCLEAHELLAHLQAFSCLPGEAELERLPRLFTEDATMAEAAVGGGRSGEQESAGLRVLSTRPGAAALGRVNHT